MSILQGSELQKLQRRLEYLLFETVAKCSMRINKKLLRETVEHELSRCGVSQKEAACMFSNLAQVKARSHKDGKPITETQSAFIAAHVLGSMNKKRSKRNLTEEQREKLRVNFKHVREKGVEDKKLQKCARFLRGELNTKTLKQLPSLGITSDEILEKISRCEN